MVEFNNISVHIFTELHREEINLSQKWTNPVTDQEVEEWEKLS